MRDAVDHPMTMGANLWRTRDAADDRLLVVVGGGHVLRQLLGEMPVLCPTSPPPLLD